MNELVFKRNDQVVTSSRNVARDFGKEHFNVVRDIEGILKNEDTQQMFYKTTYIHPQNKQEYKEYLMNRDGFTLLVMGFTGKKAIDFKLKYINAFNEMEQQLKQGLVDLSQLSPDLQAFGKIFNSMARMELSQKETIERVDRVEKSQEGIKEVIMISNENWRNSVNKIINTIAKKNGGSYSQARKESYSRLENRGRCILDRRLENKKERMRKEGQSKSNINKVNKLDVIDDDPKLKEIYLAVVKEMAIEYGVEKELA